jgi:NADH dehydrogenase
MSERTDQRRKRILILGGGFGGVYAAMYLQKALKRRTDFEVALVNQENYFVFQPMLAEVISGSIGILHTITPIRQLCPRVTLYVRKVESIDLDKKVVVTSHGFRPQLLEIDYDYLVLALGTENFLDVPGLQEHGLPFKNLGDALVLRNRLIHILEEADIERDEGLRRSMLTFVMAGGGFSGVEAIAEVNDFVREVARRYPHLNPAELRVVLIHSGPRILPELPEELSRYAQRLLDRRKVEIRLRARLAAVTANEAVLNDGTRMPTKTVMATIGSTPNPVLTALPCAKERGRIITNEFLQVADYPGVWALGDCARIIDHKTGQPCPPTAQYATREAKCLAANLLTTIDGQAQRPFSFDALGMMGSLGHRSAVGKVLGIKVSGMLAWFMWRAVYWAKLPGFNRKLHVAIDWFLDLILSKDIVQLNVAPSESISREHFEAGEIVFRQGEWGDRAYVIIHGEVEVLREDAGQGETMLARLQDGECFGEMALINDAPRMATVRTVTRVDALTLQRSAFATLFTHMPALRDSFQRMVQERSGINLPEEMSEPQGAWPNPLAPNNKEVGG